MIFLLGIFFCADAQRWTNVSPVGLGGGSETGRGVCTDASGNVYYIGIFSAANTDFDPGGGSTLLSPAGVTDVFITKYNSSGVFQWATRCGGPSQDQGIGIATDGTNVYIIGNFNLSATFGAISLSSLGGVGTDLFVASLSAASGGFNWAVRYGASGAGGDNGHAICTDGAGGLFITGTFNGSATFGAFPLSATGGSGVDLFVAKLAAADGSVAWAVGGGSSASSDNGLGSTICYHPGLNEVIVGGSYFGATATYGSFNLTNSGGNDLVLLELNAANGTFLHALGFGGSGGLDDDLAGICYDPFTQDVFITGFYNGGLTFTGTPALPNSGLGDFYVARYAPATNTFVWSISGGSTLDERSFGICSNGQGTVYIAGYYSGDLTFGSTNLTAVTPAPEVLVAGVGAADGEKQWALTASGNDATLADQARAISSGGPMGKIAVTGQFAGSGTFGTFNLSAVGSVDIFFAQVAGALIGSASGTPPTCNNGCNGTATVSASGGVSPYTYLWSPGGGSAATANNLCAGNYSVTVTDAIGQTTIESATVTFPATSTASELAENLSVNISAANTIIASATCRLIAKVVPNGGSPIGGATSAFVKFEPSVPTFPLVGGQPFVQRHYQITPTSGAASATGRVTLYFTQAEFDLFNAHAGAILKLPVNAGDAAGKANVRIGKYPGNSTDNSGLPGTYTGASEVINPNDADIIFNVPDNRWEISFNVIGFSGFVLQTSTVALPVNWKNVSVFFDAQKRAQLKWEVQEANVADYFVERSQTGDAYASVATIPSQGDGEHTYNYTDPATVTGRVYYRIRQTDKDGRTTYSQILIVNNQEGGTVTVYPNPTSGMMNLNITDRSLMNTVARLYNSDGRELQQIYIRQTVTAVSLTGYVKGAYFLRLSNGETLRLIRK